MNPYELKLQEKEFLALVENATSMIRYYENQQKVRIKFIQRAFSTFLEVKEIFSPGRGIYPVPERIHFYVNSEFIGIDVNAGSFKDFKIFSDMLHLLGFKRASSSSPIKDSPTPSWGFQKSIEESFSISLHLNFSFSNNKDNPNLCRMEQVGMKEVPDYQLICPEGEKDEKESS